MAGGLMMSGMSGASMLRTRRRDVNVKPNRRLDRKSSRGMLYENEELRLRTININAEVERGQSDIKKLRRENEQLKREIGALRYEYERLDRLLRERRLSVSPEHSDQDSASVCSACPECAVIEASPARAQVSFQDLTVVPEEDAEGIKSSIESRCSCEECSAHVGADNQKTRIENNAQNNRENLTITTNEDDGNKPVDVLLHDAPPAPKFFQTLTSPAYQSPPPPGFNISPYQTPTPIGRFKNGGNVEDLLGDMQATPLHTTFIQQNSVFMCNTKKVMQKPCQCCLKSEQVTEQKPKHYVTEKNIELNYDYPRATPMTPPTPNPDTGTTTTEVASTVVFVERRIPVRPRKFDFFFRSRSAPVGENEEPIYATVNKLPKRLKRMELANLEKEVAYKAHDPPEPKTDSEQSQAPVADDDTSPSEVEKVVQRQDTPKAKKRKRFSLTFKKRERKRRELKKDLHKNGTTKNGVVPVEENDRLLSHETVDLKSSLAPEVHKHCPRHRPRNTLSSSSSGPRYRRDSCYQEMTTSHSEHERTNSMCSSMNSLASACTHKSRKLSAAPTGDAIPWCGCWGAGCV